MLNRIYIVVGIFAILVLAGAFIAPRFIQWSDYRDRMEALATDVMGAEVTIRGEIAFSLLPSPRLEFHDVIVGDAEAPAATVASVEAEFALIDFLRDNYTLTDLRLLQPVVDLVLDENGLFSTGLDVAGNSAVALNRALISNGSVRLTDLRADDVFTATRIDGDLRLASFSGPFQFQGAADYEGSRYDLRFNSGAPDAAGGSRVTAFLREVGGGFSVDADGTLVPGMAPKFDGTLTYRQAPPAAENADDIRGDLVLTGELAMSADRATIGNLTLLPDENRTGTRLTGAANVQFGARREFDAVISGGVFSLPPRDATEVAKELPYEAVRLLSELPAPPIPPLPGKLGIDLAEISLRGFALRELRLDAKTDGTTWRIEQAIAEMPGDTEVRLAGTVSNEEGRLGFLGDVSFNAQRLDALAQLWRRPREDNPLFNTPGALQGRLILGGDAFGLTNGRFDFAGQLHEVEMRIGFGDEPRLDAVVNLGTLDAGRTNALLALLPDIGNEPRFAVSFPTGSFSLAAQSLDVFGLPATGLVAEGQWSPGDLRFGRLATTDWGGLGLSAALRLAGSLTDPRATGSGQFSVRTPDAEGLVALYEMTGVPFGWQEGLAASWPAELQFILSDNDTDSGQVLTLGGTLGAGAFDMRAEMAAGLAQINDADLRLVASLEGNDGVAIQEQLNLGATPIFSGDGPLLASLFFEGSGPDGFEGRIGLNQDSETLSYFGRLSIAENGDISGDGSLDAVLGDSTGLAALAGLNGARLAGIDANTALAFDAGRSVSLTNIAGVAGDVGFTGELVLQRTGQVPALGGSLSFDSVDALGLAASVFGAEALSALGDGLFPEGPIATDIVRRDTRGNVEVHADAVDLLGAPWLSDTTFTYSWDPDTVSIAGLQAQAGNGSIALTLNRCCAGPLSDRTLSGRLAISGVGMDALVPAGIASGLGGELQAGLQFEGSGASLADVMRAMTGEGNFTVTDFVATGLSWGVFPAIASIEDPLNTDAETIETLIGLGLGQGDFTAETARGAFTIAGGTARLANLIVEGAGGLLSGSLNVALETLGLNGTFALTPREYEDPNGLVQTDTARILVRLAGSLLAPEVSVDLTEMVAAIQVRANELEVERLEVLRLEDEARQREAAEARNRLIEEQRQRAAEEAAQRAAEEARRAAEEQEALEQAPAPLPPASQPETPFTFQPPVNQPLNNGINQPF